MIREERIAIECVDAAIEAGGSDPYDCDGNCLLPLEPQEGDWTYLREQIADRAVDEVSFRRAYETAMRSHIETMESERA